MFKVSKSGKGISEAALRYKSRWLTEQTGVKTMGVGEGSEKAGWGGRSREGKSVGCYSPGSGVAKNEGLVRP